MSQFFSSSHVLWWKPPSSLKSCTPTERGISKCKGKKAKKKERKSPDSKGVPVQQRPVLSQTLKPTLAPRPAALLLQWHARLKYSGLRVHNSRARPLPELEPAFSEGAPASLCISALGSQEFKSHPPNWCWISSLPVCLSNGLTPESY